MSGWTVIKVNSVFPSTVKAFTDRLSKCRYQACSAAFRIFCMCEQMVSQSALRLVLEAQIREEVSAEYMKIFSEMEKDYRWVLITDGCSEAAEGRSLSTMVDWCLSVSVWRGRRRSWRRELKRGLSYSEISPARPSTCPPTTLMRRWLLFQNKKCTGGSCWFLILKKEEQTALMELIRSLTKDLERIKEDAQSVHSCLTEDTHGTGKHSVICFSLSDTCQFIVVCLFISYFCCANVYFLKALGCVFAEALPLEKQKSHQQLQEAREVPVYCFSVFAERLPDHYSFIVCFLLLLYCPDSCKMQYILIFYFIFFRWKISRSCQKLWSCVSRKMTSSRSCRLLWRMPPMM